MDSHDGDRAPQEMRWPRASDVRAPREAVPAPDRGAPGDAVIVWAVDAGGRFTLWEGDGCAATGHEPGELVGRSITEVWPDVLPRRDPVTLLAGGTAGETLTETVERSGIVWETLIVRLAAPGDASFIGLSRDVTAHARVDADLRAREAALRDLTEHVRDILWLEAPGGEIEYVSPAYEDIFGTSREALRDDPRAFVSLIHPEDRARVVDALRQMACGEPFDETYRVIRPDGTLRVLHDRGFPIYDDEGRLHRVAGIAEDVTTAKDMERELRQHRDALEALVEERTAQVRAMESQRAEDRSWAMTGKIAAQIAHEINNPLASIKAAVLLLEETVPPEHQHFSHLQRLPREIDRLAFIVRQIFTLYQPRTQTGEDCDAPDVVRDVSGQAAGSARERGVQIEVRSDAGPVRAGIPEASLRQVLLNVLQNAVDASPTGGTVTVTVTARADRATVTVLVEDHGPGIPANILARAFEPFFTTKKGGDTGLGLGLPISRNLVESVGGSLRLASTVGRGTVCEIVLPG